MRVLVDWSTVQASPDAPPVFDEPKDGCARGAPPCAPYRGIRDTLRAVHALGAIPVILFYGTPDWAARPPEGCEREGVTPYARTPRIAPYRAMVRAVLALGEREGVSLPYLSAWNEPNTPVFLNPQRAGCDIADRSLAVARYAELVRALAAEVGMDRVVLGEAAGIERHTHATGAAELAAGLPDDLVCGAAVWAQHAYVSAPQTAPDGRVTLRAVEPGGTRAIVRGVERALDRHGCAREVPLWISETGAGDRPGACAAMAARLRDWRRDPRIRAAFQYTLRDDPIFPVGLADAGLTRLYPAHEAWRTRGASC